MNENEKRMQLPKVSIDDLFTTQKQRDEQKLEKVEKISLDLIDDFEVKEDSGVKHNPFGIREDDEEVIRTFESIAEVGQIHPAIVRRKENGRYELISGHRRKLGCKKAGLKTLDCIVRDLSDDDATILMVDSNFQRENILPSERAFAYKMRLEALKHQGKKDFDFTCTQVGHKSENKKSIQVLAEQVGESKTQVQRYIRLTYLIPEILQFVDNDYLNAKDKQTMALTPAVEISYMKKEEQDILLKLMETTFATPSVNQAKRLREESEKGKITEDIIAEIMCEEKPNQKEQLKLSYDKVKDYFPKGYTIEKMQEIIEKLLKNYQERWQKRNREDR